MRAIIYGVLASLFFASTFVCNRSMELTGGHWAWSAALRFLFMLPLLIILVVMQGQFKASWLHFRHHAKSYFIWSTIGFGIFYSFVCIAAVYGEGWLVASSWQLVIICGSLLAPLFKTVEIAHGKILTVRQKIPWASLKWSLLILFGIALMQIQQARTVGIGQVLGCVLPILVAAFAYPLGNRKMMEVCQGDINTLQRVLNMTIASLPFWCLVVVYGYYQSGLPSTSQLEQSFVVALFSGVIATLLFFAATNIVRHSLHGLAAVEATQAGELVFALIGEIIILGSPMPSSLSLLGVGLVTLGVILHSLNPKLAKN